MESTSCSIRPHDTLVSGTSAKANTSEDELVRLSRRVIELLNDRAYDDPWFEQHVSPNVRIDFNGTCIGIGYKDFVGFYRLDADVSPRFCCDVDIMTAMVNENQGTATVILSEVLTGFEDDLMVGKKRAASILWSWKRVKGRWVCQSCCLMFGTCEFLV